MQIDSLGYPKTLGLCARLEANLHRNHHQAELERLTKDERVEI